MNHYSRSTDTAALTFVLLWCATSPARAEPFIGQFELKTLESAPGSFEFQSQNAWSWDQPSRQIASGSDGADFDDNSVATLTIGLGLLEGLNGNTPEHTLKLSIEVDF